MALERRGGTFLLSEHEHAAGFTLPDFLLTDRLRTAARIPRPE
jgi:hypothetical protein